MTHRAPSTVALMPALLLVLLLAALPLRAQDAAGFVTALRGQVEALSTEGVTRFLAVDEAVFAGERIDTGRRASVNLEFRDGTRFELGASSSMTVDSYAEGENASLTTTVLGGIFRFVSGLIARQEPQAMRVNLSVATIGIRGTNVVGEVGPTSAQVILLEPEEGDGPTAIEVSNAFGAVIIDQPGFGTDIPDANSPPSPPRRMAQRNIQNLMRTLQAVGRIGTPVMPRF